MKIIIKKITSEHSINVCLILLTSLHVLKLSSVNTFAFQSLTKITTNKNSKQTCQKTCPVKCDLLSKNKLYISSQLYSGLLVINQQVKQRSVSCSSCQPPSMSFAAHLQVFDDIFVPVLNWNHLLCHLSDLCFKLSPSFHFFFITSLCKLKSNSEEIDVQTTGSRERGLKILLKILPSWSQLSASMLSQSEMSNFTVCPINIK